MKIFIFILLFSFSLVSFANSGGITNLNPLETKMKNLSKKISDINSNSEDVKKISEEYNAVARKHLTAVTNYNVQVAVCDNLDAIYQRKRNSESLDSRVIQKQNSNLTECRNTAALISVNFESMDLDFNRLTKSIKTLEQMASTGEDEIESLLKQVSAISSIIKAKKAKEDFGEDRVEGTIDNMSN